MRKMPHFSLIVSLKHKNNMFNHICNKFYTIYMLIENSKKDIFQWSCLYTISYLDGIFFLRVLSLLSHKSIFTLFVSWLNYVCHKVCFMFLCIRLSISVRMNILSIFRLHFVWIIFFGFCLGFFVLFCFRFLGFFCVCFFFVFCRVLGVFWHLWNCIEKQKNTSLQWH